MKTQRERDLERLAEIRRLDAEREFRRMGNVVQHNADVLGQSANAEKARREQNNLIASEERRQRTQQPRTRGK